MAAECSWSASSPRLARRDLTDQAYKIPLSVAQLGDPHFAAIHPGDDVRLRMTRRAGGSYRRVGALDVADVVEQHRVLGTAILTLCRGARQHQSYAATIEEGERRRRVEEVLHAQHVLVELLRLLHVVNGQGDLLDA